MPRQDTTLEAEGAEFLVLGQLLIRGIAALKAYTRQPGHDLVATSLETNRSARIQVKSAWSNYTNHFTVKNFDADLIVFVKLNRGHNKNLLATEEPEFFIMTKDVARKLAKDPDHWQYIRLNRNERDFHRNQWKLIEQFLKKSPRRKLAKAI